MIQYAYRLFNINGASTKISSLSDLVPLSKNLGSGGGDENEIVGQINEVTITGIDTKYDVIQLYAIKYSGLNQTPKISLIVEESIASSTLIFRDDGSTIYDISLSEFTFLGGDPVAAKSITSKDNRLFALNLKEFNFDIDLDTRAYSFKDESGGVGFNWRLRINGTPNIDDNFATEELLLEALEIIPEEHDAINYNFDDYKYNYSTGEIGGQGLYIGYELLPKTSGQLPDSVENLKLLKSGELS